ncbi:MAG: inner membrane-spanning protein YciB, partial [Salinisphaeraceae bacterium]|nr:inner membrane-spanning protein YciB [Salinisphaeraceae bacterium]
IYIATAVLIPALFIAAIGHWVIDRKPPKLQLWVAVLALVLGGTTLALQDPLFIKVKPTVMYLIFGSVLYVSRFIGKKPLLARIPQTMLVMPEAVWDRIHLAWSMFFLFCAALNVYVFSNYDDVVWGAYKSFGVSIMMFAFMLGHIPFLHRYIQEPDKAETEEESQSGETPTAKEGHN